VIFDSIEVQTQLEFTHEAQQKTYNTVRLPGVLTEFPIVSHFVSTLFCLGHIKSTKSKDEQFIKAFENSAKWLKVVRQ
jgi:hypothetical protein